jgi:hypothetical protein
MIPPPEQVNLTIPMEIGSTSKAKKRKENEAYYIRMRTCNARSSSTLQVDSEVQEMAVNVVSASAEEILHEAMQSVV